MPGGYLYSYLLRPGLQTPRQEYLDRSIAVEPDILLESPVWERLVASREPGASADLASLWDELRKLQPSWVRLNSRPASSAH
jgi:hypothetical protein